MSDHDATLNPSLRRQQHRDWIRESAMKQQSARARASATYAIAQRSGDADAADRMGLARYGVARLGLDGGKFAAMPEWYQTLIEGPGEPKPGFFGRMWGRVKDGDLMSRRGHMGFQAATGRLPIDQAFKESSELTKQMSSGEWAVEQGGVLPWIEQHAIGQALEIVGQQARHIPAGLLAAAGGAALGSLAGPVGAARGAQIGGFLGVAGANTKMIAGNAYLDFMEEPLVLPDGTQTQMPHEIARNMSYAIGAFDGAIESLQLFTAAGKVPGFSALQNKARAILMKRMVDGSLKSIAQRAAIGMLTSAAANTVQEMVQETTAVLGQELAYEITRGTTGAQRIHAQELGKQIMETLSQTALTAPAFAFLALPAGVGTMRSGVAQRQATRNPATYFDQEMDGEDKAISELVVPSSISEQQTALTKLVLEQARRGIVRLPPIEVTPREDGGFTVVKPEQQAIVAGLQAVGVDRVRALDLQVKAEEEAQAKAEAMKPVTETPAAPVVEVDEPTQPATEVEKGVPTGPVTLRSLTDFEAVRQQLIEAVGDTQITEEEATGAAIYLEYHAQAMGMSLAEYVEKRFQDGRLIAGGDQALSVLSDEPPSPPQEEDAEGRQTTEDQRPSERKEEGVGVSVVVDHEPTVDEEVPSRHPSPADQPPVAEGDGVVEDGEQTDPGEGVPKAPTDEATGRPDGVVGAEPVEAVAPSLEKPTVEQEVEEPAQDAVEHEPTVPEQGQELDAAVLQYLQRQERPLPLQRIVQGLRARQDRVSDALLRLQEQGTIRRNQRGQWLVVVEPTVVDEEVPSRQAGQTIEQWWADSLTPQGRRLALRGAGFNEGDVERIHKMSTIHMDDSILAVLERSYPEPTPERPRPVPVVTPDPQMADYDSAALTGVGPELNLQDRGATVVWEAEDGTAQVVAGSWRAALAQRAAERGEMQLSVPAYRFRESDGVTLEEAQRRGRAFSDRSGQTLADIARVLRRLPAEQRFQDLPVVGDLYRQALGLAAAGDTVWDLVETSAISPIAAAEIGRLLPTDITLQEEMAMSFERTPPRSAFEAEVRIRIRQLGDASPVNTDRERVHLARIVTRMLMRPRTERLADAAAATIERGGPLHDDYQRDNWSDGGVLGRALALWTINWPTVRDQVNAAMADMRRNRPGSRTSDTKTGAHADAILGRLISQASALRRPVTPAPAAPTDDPDRPTTPPREEPPAPTAQETEDRIDQTESSRDAFIRQAQAALRGDDAVPKPPPKAAAPTERQQEQQVHVTGPQAKQTTPKSVETASQEDLIAALKATMEGEEPDVLFQDGPVWSDKQIRLFIALMARIMWDDNKVTFPEVADQILGLWGQDRHTEAVRGALGPMYEIARGTNPPFVEQMSSAEEIEGWYGRTDDVQRDVPADDGRASEPGTGDAGGERADGEPPAGRGEGREPDVPPDRGTEPDPATASGSPRSGDPADARGDRERPEPVHREIEAAGNWSFVPGTLTETEQRSPRRKAEDNITAIEVVKKLALENRGATRAEQEVIARYVGWGGLKNAFPDPRTGAFREEFREIGPRLQELLTESEYRTARRSVQYAHYTSELVVSQMWDAVRRLGFAGGKVLDPGSGIGHFAGVMPRNVARRSTYVGVEMDGVTSAIAAALYPEWTIRRQDFSKTQVPPGMFDLAIGNPPFANFTVSDPKYSKFKFVLHDYFFAKSVDGLRPGGLMAFVSSAGTMNKQSTTARQYLADRADFLGAIRLPNIAFKKNAGTEVTTDLVFMRKRAEGAEPNHAGSFVEAPIQQLPDKDGGTGPHSVNQWFIDHPEFIIGEHGLYDTLTAGARYGVRATKGLDLAKELLAAVDRLVEQAPAMAATDPAPTTEPGLVAFVESERKDGTYVVDDEGKLWQYRGGALREPTRSGASGNQVSVNRKQEATIRAFIPVRDSLSRVIAANLADDQEAGDAARADLVRFYEAFVSEYGPIKREIHGTRKRRPAELETVRQEIRERTRLVGGVWEEGSFDDTPLLNRKPKAATKSEIATARQAARERLGDEFDEGTFDPADHLYAAQISTPNIALLRADPEIWRVAALESSYDSTTNTAERSEVFTENTIRRDTEPKIETATDAMAHVMATTGSFDIGTAATAWGRSVDETISELGDLVFFDPAEDDWVMSEEYLSGDVVEKLARAREDVDRNPDLQRNVDALVAVQPEPLPPSQITVQVGANWVPPHYVEQFAGEVVQLDRPRATYNGTMARWNLQSADARWNQAANAAFGAMSPDGEVYATGNAAQILHAALNQRVPKAPRFRDSDGRSYADEEGDKRIAEAVARIRQAWLDWVWNDEGRADDLGAIYNAKFNTSVGRKFRTDWVTTPGASSHWKWRQHQLRAIARGIITGNEYINHAVGSGKTSTMVALAMELRRLGLAKKPMFVVPNHMLSQFTTEWYELYPQARLLVADEYQFHKDRRKAFVGEAGTNDYDGIIMTFSSFKLLPISAEFSTAMIQQQIDEYEEALIEAKEEGDRFTVRDLEAAIERFEEALEKAIGEDRDQVFTFEETGVDMLFVDEAHRYRKLSYLTRQGNIKGINPKGSNEAQDLYYKSRYLDSVNPGRSMVFASGTPITNTLAELYTIQRYLGLARLQEQGLELFDAWAGIFGSQVSEMEQDATGAYSYVSRFYGIPNAYDLYRMVGEFMDVVTSQELHQYVTVPALAGGERERIILEQTDMQRTYQGLLAERLEDIRNRIVPPDEDNLLKLINDGRHAALDMRFVSGYGDIEEVTKLERLIDRTWEIYQASTHQPFHALDDDGQYKAEPEFTGPATQMIFSALGFKRDPQRLHLPTYIRQKLMARGVPESEIRYMGDYKDQRAKKRLFNDMNDGTARILIGSEENMGTGVNAQRRLIALHLAMPLWYPAADEQRVGRALRQGNMNPEINVIEYSTKGTYDASMWQLMKRKARMIERFFRGDPTLRMVEDISEASSYETAMALTTGDPRALRLAELNQQIEKAEREKAAADDRRWQQRSAATSLGEEIRGLKGEIKSLESSLETMVDYAGDAFEMEIAGARFKKRADAAEELNARIAAAYGRQKAERVRLGRFAGFTMSLESDLTNERVVTGVRGGTRGIEASSEVVSVFRATLLLTVAPGRDIGVAVGPDDGSTAIASFEARLRSFPEEIAKRALKVDTLEERRARALEEAAKPAPTWEEIDEMRRERAEIEASMVPAEQQAEIPDFRTTPDEPTAEDAAIVEGLLEQRYGPPPPEVPRLQQRSDVVWDPNIERWRTAPDFREPLGLAGQRWRSQGEALDAIDAARAQRRAAIGGDTVVEELFNEVAAGNRTEDIDQASYIGRDGTMIRRPKGRYSGDRMIEGTGAVRINTRARMLHAAAPLSEAQRSTIIGALAGRSTVGWKLEFTSRGRRIASIVTEQPLTDLTLRAHFSRSRLFSGGARGGVAFDREGKAIIALSKSATFDTLMHEFAHIFRRDMTTDQEDAVAGWAGATRRGGRWVWSTEAEEKFADGFVQWLREGGKGAVTDATTSVFERAATWLKAVFAGIRMKLNPEVRRTFESLLLAKNAPEVAAFARNRAAITGGKHTYRDPDGNAIEVRAVKGAKWAVDVLGADDKRQHTRYHQDLDDAIRDVSGVPTVDTPVPLGNALMGQPAGATPQRAPMTVEEAALRLESDDVTVEEAIPKPSESEADVLHQTAEDPREVARRIGYARGFEAGTAQTVRAYETVEVVRFARARMKEIRDSLVQVMNETTTLPAGLRDQLRTLLTDLNLRRYARSYDVRETMRRAEPGPRTTRTDPARLVHALKMLLDESDMPPGLLTDWGDRPFASMKLVELEQLRNTVLHAVHRARDEQRRARAAVRAVDEENVTNARKEVGRLDPNRKPTWVQGIGRLFGEKPDYQLERIGGGLASTIFRVLWGDVKQGALAERTMGDRVRADFERALRREGITMNATDREVWLNERMEVPDWARKLKRRWRRGDIMTLALLARDPYAARNLTHEDGGVVLAEGRGAQPTEPHVFTARQLNELIGLLGDRAMRFIGRPVREMFDTLFKEVNATFREKHGYDLEQWPSYFPVAVATVGKPGDFDTGNAVEHFRYLGERHATPFKGMVQFRTHAIKPMVVRPISPVLNRALGHAAAYHGLEIPLTRAAKLIYDRKFRAMLQERVGVAVPEEIEKYLRDMAHVYDLDELVDMLGFLRNSVTVGSLGLNVKVALSQALSYPIYGLYVPERYLAQAIGQMAVHGSEIIRRHEQHDPDFRQRTNAGFDADVRSRQAGRSLLPPVRSRLAQGRAQLTDMVMWMVGAVDKATVGTGMQAAVNHALEVLRDGGATNKMREVLGPDVDNARNMDLDQREELAYKWARWVTSRTQPMFLSEHMNHFARGRALKLLTMFSGYTNAAANAIRYALREARDADWKDGEKNSRAAKAVLTIAVLNPLGVGMLAYLQDLILRGEDETDPLWQHWVRNMTTGLSTLFGYMWRDIAYAFAYGRDFAATPTLQSVGDSVDAIARFARSLVSGDEDRIMRSMERILYAAFRTVGLPISGLRYAQAVLQAIFG